MTGVESGYHQAASSLSCSEQLREVERCLTELLHFAPRGVGRKGLLVDERQLAVLLDKVGKVYGSTRGIEYALALMRTVADSVAPGPRKNRRTNLPAAVIKPKTQTPNSFDGGAEAAVHRRQGRKAGNANAVIRLTRLYQERSDVRVGAAEPGAYRIAYRLLKQGETMERVAEKLLLPFDEVRKLELILRDETAQREVKIDEEKTAAPRGESGAAVEREQVLL